MKNIETIYLILISILVSNVCHANHSRLIVCTDIGGSDPDDQQSLIHLLTTVNGLDLEGVIFQHAWAKYNKGNEVIVTNKIINAYGLVLPNLKIHASGFPEVDELRELLKHGQKEAGMAGIGFGKDSPGSEHIISVVDRQDDRPVWIAAWSGLNTLAQAIWKVKSSRSTDEVMKFVKKIRVYDVLGQDDAGAWIAKNFPELVYIRNKHIYGWGPSDEWIRENVQKVGLLGKEYPDRIWATEGDSPSFMYLLDNGLNAPEHFDWGGWGGRFDLERTIGVRSMDWVKRNGLDETVYDPYYMIANAPEGCMAINMWKHDIYNDFAARMQWTCKSNYQDANHHPVIVVNGSTSNETVRISVKSGTEVCIDASNSYDPDGDMLKFEWIQYMEPSSFQEKIFFNNSTQVLKFNIPICAKGLMIHMILRVTDVGIPELSSYRRFVFDVI